MKRTVLAFLGFGIMGIAANAQTEKGTLLLGGNLSFTSVENTSSFQASPNIGFFVAENFAIGGQFSLFTSEGFTSWGVGPFARYYFTKNQNGKPFAGANLNVGGNDNSDTKVGFGARAGYALFLNKSIALEFGVQYSRNDGIDMIGAGAGFQIHFNRK